jgi:hypothetical protein
MSKKPTLTSTPVESNYVVDTMRVEVPSTHKSGNVSIKPFFDPNRKNLGLEQYNMTLFEGVCHEEQLACIERNGIRRYLNGLNEFAPEVKLMKDPEEREAKIKEIRTVVAQLERELAANIISIDDPDFWNKVKLLRHDNDEFWSNITIRCGNDPVRLDPEKDPYDLIKLYAIEAGGFSIVAKSYEDARSMAVAPKFFLDKYVNTLSTRTELTKLRNRAVSELTKLFDSNQNKLFYIAKVVDANSTQYKKSTPNDVIYENMDRYVHGQGIETNAKRAAQSFLDACEMDMETLKIKSLVKDATFYKFIVPKPDGFIYHLESGNMMGRTVADCVAFLKNPLNEDVLISITKKVEKYWNM